MWENIKLFVDYVAAGAILGTLTGVLPPVAALLAIIWYAFLIHDRLKYGPKK